MTIFIFGNPDLIEDSLPLRILPKLCKKFLQIKFEHKDSNEEWDIPKDLIILDTVLGIEDIAIFDDIKKFDSAPRVSTHDFDAMTNIRFLIKLGKIKKLKIIGIPSNMEESIALNKVSDVLRNLSN
ncbi:MAG: hypothetical protein AAB637_00550 [Patescibacteria group bacterium]|mgnify:FL=1